MSVSDSLYYFIKAYHMSESDVCRCRNQN